MLQAGALGSSDYNLRIPTKIRHLAILDSNPAIPAGSQGTSFTFLNLQAAGALSLHNILMLCLASACGIRRVRPETML
jgi:hypothetical protein